MTKTILAQRNPAITVKAEFVKLSVEYFVVTYATTRLTIKPTVPEINRFLLRDIVLLYLLQKFAKNFVTTARSLFRLAQTDFSYSDEFFGDVEWH